MRIPILVGVVLVLALGTTMSVQASSDPAGIYLEMANGSRVKGRKTAVYFVDQGVLRHVHYKAYRRLWRGWGGIAHVNRIPEAAVGEPMRGTCRLVRVPGKRHVWFIDNDRVRRWVPSFAVSQFSWAKVGQITAEALADYEQGPDLR